MSTFYECDVRLSGLDVDGRGHCKASALLNHLQNTATLAAEDMGFSREVLLERYGAFWMLARIWYRLEEPVLWDDRLTVQTWHRGDGHGPSMYRDFDIFRAADASARESASGSWPTPRPAGCAGSPSCPAFGRPPAGNAANPACCPSSVRRCRWKRRGRGSWGTATVMSTATSTIRATPISPVTPSRWSAWAADCSSPRSRSATSRSACRGSA